MLPADYVAEHVDLGDAITAQRVQSRTVDTAHVITGPGMSREHLYVAMSRGRHTNHVYTSLDVDAEPHHRLRAGTPPATGRQLLAQILATRSAKPSAIESLEATLPPRPHPAFMPSAPITLLGRDAHTSRAPDGPGISR